MLKLFILIVIGVYGYIMGIEIIAERPEILYVDPKAIRYVNLTIRRVSRHSPYYVNLSVDTLYSYGNNVTVNARVLELLSSGQYTPTPLMLEHIGFCDFFEKDPLIGQRLLREMVNWTCPVPAGVLHFRAKVPRFDDFPFHLPFAWDHHLITEGRVEVTLFGKDMNATLFQYRFHVTATQKPRKRLE